MSNYTLNIGFTTDDLKLFFATGTNLIIAKPAADSTTPNVAWLVVQPMEANSVSWEEQYGIYASTVDVVNGAVLTKMSHSLFPAVMQKLYNLSAAGTIDLQPDKAAPNAFTLTNLYDSPKNYMTVGLYQAANVNGAKILDNAISAAPVIKNYQAVMTPYTTVYLWMQSQVKSNSVVTNITSTTTQVTFGGGITTASLQYNGNTGGFTLLPASKSLLADSALEIRHLPPQL